MENNQELSAREIYNLLREGNRVTLGMSQREAELLLNHLNVIKSRDRKLYKELGLDYNVAIIKCIDLAYNLHLFELVMPTPNKKYTTFSIEKKP